MSILDTAWSKSKVSAASIKIADFGLLKVLGSKLGSSRVGTFLYMAPEVVSGIGYLFK